MVPVMPVRVRRHSHPPAPPMNAPKPRSQHARSLRQWTFFHPRLGHEGPRLANLQPCGQYQAPASDTFHKDLPDVPAKRLPPEATARKIAKALLHQAHPTTKEGARG